MWIGGNGGDGWGMLGIGYNLQHAKVEDNGKTIEKFPPSVHRNDL